MSTPEAGYVEVGGVSFPCETQADREHYERLKALETAPEASEPPAAPVEPVALEPVPEPLPEPVAASESVEVAPEPEPSPEPEPEPERPASEPKTRKKK